MPDEQGNLSKEERAKAIAWIESHWRLPGCPVSGHTDWELGAHQVTMISVAGSGAINIGGSIYPHVLLVCKGCGYTMMFNTMVMGLGNVEQKDDTDA